MERILGAGRGWFQHIGAAADGLNG